MHVVIKIKIFFSHYYTCDKSKIIKTYQQHPSNEGEIPVQIVF